MKAVPLTFRCPADWDRMTPRAGGRFCGECQKVVYNLTAMGEEAARVLLRAHDKGDLCVRYAQNAEGNILFAPAAQPLIPGSLLDRAKRAAVAATLALPLTACSSTAPAVETTTAHADVVPGEAAEWYGGGVSWAPDVLPPDAGADSAADADAGSPDASGSEEGGAMNAVPIPRAEPTQ
jgi:hypothetical protein